MPANSRPTSTRLEETYVPTLLGVLQRPGVQRIFVHDYQAVDIPTLRSIDGSGAHRFAERALVMAQRGDIVVTTDQTETEYLAYLEELGIGPDRNDIVALDALPRHAGGARAGSLLSRLAADERAAQRIAERVDYRRETRLMPYFAAPAVAAVQSRLEHALGRRVVVESGSAIVADHANRKDLVRNAALHLGVPTAEGEVCSWASTDVGSEPRRTLTAAIRRHLDGTGAVMVRGAWSMHGVDNLIVADESVDEDLVSEWLAQREHLRTYLVETKVPVLASPNLQLWISEDGGCVEHLGITNQRLDANSSHCGNEFPHCTELDHSLVASALALGRWLSSIGYVGPLGVDFIETVDRSTGKPAHLLAEVNGRINGATYALALTERINQVRTMAGHAPISAWITNTHLKVRARSFACLRDALGDLIYRHGSACGVVPYNTGLLAEGMVHAAIVADTVADARRLELEMIDRVGAA